jgi:hypothetical protein
MLRVGMMGNANLRHWDENGKLTVFNLTLLDLLSCRRS